MSDTPRPTPEAVQEMVETLRTRSTWQLNSPLVAEALVRAADMLEALVAPRFVSGKQVMEHYGATALPDEIQAKMLELEYAVADYEKERYTFRAKAHKEDVNLCRLALETAIARALAAAREGV